MASMRVHELAKEFDMTSKDLLDRLHEMKIPATSHASMLADAYVEKIRKNLEPEIKARAGQLEDEEAAALITDHRNLSGEVVFAQLIAVESVNGEATDGDGVAEKARNDAANEAAPADGAPEAPVPSASH